MKKNFLKKIRNQKGLTLQELSVLAKSSPQAISNYENFRINLGKEALERVAKALDVSVLQITTTGISHFTATDQKLLSESMMLANKFYSDLDQEEIVEIATKIFKLHHDYKAALENKTEKDFEKYLKSQLTNGLAAKAFLNKIISNKEHGK